jgi:hypothetical protein
LPSCKLAKGDLGRRIQLNFEPLTEGSPTALGMPEIEAGEPGRVRVTQPVIAIVHIWKSVRMPCRKQPDAVIVAAARCGKERWRR